MKILNLKQYITKLITILIIKKLIISLKLKDLPKDLSKISVLDVKIQEADKATSSMKEYNRKRRFERNKLRDLEYELESNKQKFYEIINLQNDQLEKLSNIAAKNVKMLESIATYDPNKLVK